MQTEPDVGLKLRRDYAMEWCEFLMGRTAADPVYRFWTGKRDPGPKYSSCGDLAHMLLRVLGCTEPWINAEAPGTSFRRGLNVNLLVPPPVGQCPVASTHPEPPLAPGDILVSWPEGKSRLAHVCVFAYCVFAYRSISKVITYDFGQGPMSPDAWRSPRSHVEGRLRVRKLSELPLRSIVRLARVPWTESPIAPTGETFDLLESGGSLWT